MSNINQIASGLYKAISEADDKKVKPYDTKAEVLRVEGDTAWVKIPGGIDETPVQMTNNANAGDTVMVRIAGGRAWLLGNNTSPATDDTRANAAYQVADIANMAAESAVKDAGRAFEAANFAEGQAVRAYKEANKAEKEAVRANRSANNALTQLGVVQDVVGTLNWISEHGTYTPTEDTVVVADRIYFAYDGATQTYNVVVPVGDENPSEEGWYTLEIDEAVTNYVSTHLALTDSGLWVLYDDDAEYAKATGDFNPNRVYFEYVNGIYVPVVEPVLEDFGKYYIQTIPTGQTSGYKVLIANNGMFVYDSAGALVTTFGENISFSADRSQYIGGDNAYIIFNATSGKMTIGGRDLDIVLGDRSLADALTDMQAEIDGAIETWYEAEDPTLSNPPAVNWITESQKENHLRDLYFNTENGHSFRWAITSTSPKTFGWVQITDADAQKALRDAEIAQQTADSKVAPNEIISSINAQPKPATTSARIQADYVNIEGAAIFNSGRLSESNLDAKYDFDIGGRNYIFNSNGLIVSGLGSAAGSNNEYRAKTFGQSYMNIPHGTEVVISFDLYMTVNTANPTLLVYNTNNHGPKSFSREISTELRPPGVNLSWVKPVGSIIDERVSVKGFINSRANPTLTTNYLEFYSNYGTSNWFSISNIKLEIGNKATDWTPAPEDVQAEINAKKSVHTLTSSYSQPYATLISWVEEGKDAGNWSVTSTAGVKVGDTVRIKCTVSDMNNTPVYCIGTVTSVDSSTKLHMISHGIDTTVIDGGKIITGSITANKIKAGEITVVGDPDGNRVEVLNNSISMSNGDHELVRFATFDGSVGAMRIQSDEHDNGRMTISYTDWGNVDGTSPKSASIAGIYSHGDSAILDLTATAQSGKKAEISIYCGTNQSPSGAIDATHQIRVTSDKRLKEHLAYLDADAVDFINALQPALFIINDNKSVGFYAQDVREADMWGVLVGENEKGFLSLNYTGIIAPLVRYCQHLNERIKELENKEVQK